MSAVATDLRRAHNPQPWKSVNALLCPGRQRPSAAMLEAPWRGRQCESRAVDSCSTNKHCVWSSNQSASVLLWRCCAEGGNDVWQEYMDYGKAV